MKGKKNQKNQNINRRNFVGDTVKIVALGSLLMPIAEACNNKRSSKPGIPGTDSTKTKRSTAKSKKKRKKWSHESLVMNTQTNVLHLPTAKVYTYYDEIKSNHLKEISRTAWSPMAENAPKLNKQQSGTILEILSLNELKQGINDEYLNTATNTLAIAFTSACENMKGYNLNTTNFRLHELMLQLIVLNTGIAVADKWQAFNSKIKKPDQLRKRQQWMASENNFNERVRYILDRQTDYMNRLTERARKYSFT
ncbi:MAG: hypothetical protein HZB42_04200 [Sphingobacteriales bacterium]|nr:hypothetical protein [Sphingobacteriales bacterium]